MEERDENGKDLPSIEYSIPLGTTALSAFDATLTRSEKRVGNVENINKKLLIIHLASDKIEGKLFVRNRRAGDQVTMFGMTKSLKKLFQEAGVPQRLRHKIPLICDDNGIVWVPFAGLCDRVRESEDKSFITLTLSGPHLEKIQELIVRT